MSEKIKQISEMAAKTDRMLGYYQKVRSALNAYPYPVNIIHAYLLHEQERYLQEQEEMKKNHEILKDLIKKNKAE